MTVPNGAENVTIAALERFRWLGDVLNPLLIEKGIYIMESLFLEELARDGIVEFLFVALPLKIRGAALLRRPPDHRTAASR